jgi:Tol biopolymer transport system component
MTADSRFERDLTAVLEDLYLGPSPDYRDEAMAAAVRTRQRPSWTFAGRWIPMADIASRPALAPRVPLRTIGAALLIIALILAAAALAIGSRQTKVPPPFGLAGNGLITLARGGDIFTVDPVSGTETAIVAGPEDDSTPVFSPDGTHIAFHRATTLSGSPANDIIVVGADGSTPVLVTAKPIEGDSDRFEWAPDSHSLLVGAPDDSAIWLFDTRATGTPRTVATDAVAYLRPFRPPNGSSILIRRSTDLGSQVILLDLASGRETIIAEGGSSEDFGAARWSPDGSQVVYNNSPEDDGASQRLFIVDADGTGTHQVTDAPGIWFDIDATWSPDGKWIAFSRYERAENGSWDVRPTGIYSITDGTVKDAGPLPRDVRREHPSADDSTASSGEGFFLEWSPDGTSLIAFESEAAGHPIIINPNDGSWHALGQLSQPGVPMQAWQRTAP